MRKAACCRDDGSVERALSKTMMVAASWHDVEPRHWCRGDAAHRRADGRGMASWTALTPIVIPAIYAVLKVPASACRGSCHLFRSR